MAPMQVNPEKVREFEDFRAFYDWLAQHHDQWDELWIKIHKVGSGLKSITAREAIDAVLCWGWIDGIRKGLDEKSFLQRYTPRGPRSIWSKVNVDNVARLEAAGLMTDHGRRHVEAAKADGRWDKAYEAGRKLEIPPDLQAAIDAVPEAKDMLGRLTEQNRFALAFRVHNLKTEAARKRKIEVFVEMLRKGETIYPQKRK
jgi:uncharacterized protein YdeI (YjbR/CyaY-like superfamily)